MEQEKQMKNSDKKADINNPIIRQGVINNRLINLRTKSIKQLISLMEARGFE